MLTPREGRSIRRQFQVEAMDEYGKGWAHLSEHQKEAEIALRFARWVALQHSPQFNDARIAWAGGAVAIFDSVGETE